MGSLRLAAVACLLCGSALAQDRMPPLAPGQLTPEQKAASEAFLAARKVEVFGPFVPLLRSPELMTSARAMGDYLRYRSALPQRISEFVILLTAREWTQDLEWKIHRPIALKAGVAPETVQAIAEGRRPGHMSDEEEAAWSFTTELARNRSVSDPTYAAALARFGEKGVMDMAGISGYYTLLAMTTNVARTPPGEGPALPRLPD